MGFCRVLKSKIGNYQENGAIRKKISLQFGDGLKLNRQSGSYT